MARRRGLLSPLSCRVALGCALLPAGRVAGSLSGQRGPPTRACSPRPPHTHDAHEPPHAIQRPAAADGGQAHAHRTVRHTWRRTRHHGGGAGPRRPRRGAARESAPVGAAASGGTPRAAAGTHSTLCVAPSAAGNASQAGRSEPLDALSLAQRQARDAPHRRTPTERTGPRACAHNAS